MRYIRPPKRTRKEVDFPVQSLRRLACEECKAMFMFDKDDSTAGDSTSFRGDERFQSVDFAACKNMTAVIFQNITGFLLFPSLGCCFFLQYPR